MDQNSQSFFCPLEQHCHHGIAYGGPSMPAQFSVILTLCDWTSVRSHILLLPLRWHYNPMQTFASFMYFSQSALFLDLSLQFVILHLLISVCTQLNHMFFGGPISCFPWGLLLNTLLTFPLLSILLTWPIQFNGLILTNGSISKSLETCCYLLHEFFFYFFLI